MQIETHIDVSQLKVIRRQKPNWSDNGNELPVYKVKISELHYNKENGRIATWISTYNSDENRKPLDELDREEYNKVIESFIKKANSADSFKNLMNDIKKKTQLNPGVILDDGTVISGNRRFTALRNLYNEENCDEKYEYFECFILPVPSTKDDKGYIKLIETKTQFSVVAEEDYNPIDRLVTIYLYLIKDDTKIWSIKEYAKKIGIPERDAKNLYNRAFIMADFLEFIDKKEMFHIARTKKIDGPVVELARLYDRIDPHEWNRIKPLFYSEINKGGDKTRVVRGAIKTYKDNRQEFEKKLSVLYDKQDKIETANRNPVTDDTQISNQDTPSPQIAILDDNVVNDMIEDTSKKNARKKPILKAEQALTSLGDIDTDFIRYMSLEEKVKLKKILENVAEKSKKLCSKIK